MKAIHWAEWLLRKVFSHKEIGWAEIGEKLTRFTILHAPWFRIYLNKMEAPNWHPQCHDHPWSFRTFILAGGYYEQGPDGLHWRRPGTTLYRPAEFTHNVITKPGQVCWSIIFTTKKVREWGHLDCVPAGEGGKR